MERSFSDIKVGMMVKVGAKYRLVLAVRDDEMTVRIMGKASVYRPSIGEVFMVKAK